MDVQYCSAWTLKLERLRDLADGWDGYSSPAPSECAIVAAKAYLTNLQGDAVEPTRLAPSVAGGVGITHKKRGRRVYVEFFNDGDVCALFSDGEATPRSRKVEPGIDGFKDLIGELRGHLDA